MRGGSYSRRMLAAGVSRHTTTPWPMPTCADLAASVYLQVWESHTTRSRVGITILALDDRHALDAGALRIEVMYGAGVLAELRLVSSVRQSQEPTEGDVLCAVLATDSERERDARRRVFTARQAVA